MANVEDLAVDQAAAIERAKAVLVQTATFDLATNDYDAQSNGNFDQVSVTGATDQDGAIYIFEYRDGDGARRVPPCRLPSLEAAGEEALRCAVDLLADPDLGVRSLPEWLVRVYDENGNLVCTVDGHQAHVARRRTSDSLENPAKG